jgi:serine/threonine-protein kinase RsbW
MDEITLTLPAKPEYVSVARLTASAVANRTGFAIDAIEDFKVAVSEAAIYLMNQSPLKALSWVFAVEEDCGLTARITGIEFVPASQKDAVPKQNELSLFILEALMDQVVKRTEAGFVREISIYKACGGQMHA